MSDAEPICCPKFEPGTWDGKTLEWKDKLFARDQVFCVFHIPLNIGSVMGRVWKKIQAAGADSKDAIFMFDERSMWSSQLYASVTKEVPDAQMVHLSGTFFCKEFEGEYREVPKWYEQMKGLVAAQGKTMEQVFFYYTTCPKCAKKYGKNYVVLIAKVG